MTPDDKKESSSAALRRVAASSAPAFVWTAIGCPFDVIKTRLQTATTPFASPVHCLIWTVRREGLPALWKGFLPQLLVSTPYSVIMFGVFDLLKPQQPQSPRGHGEGFYLAGCFLAGAASGVAVTAVHNPLELWRVRVQTHLAADGSSNGQGSTNSSVLRGLRQRPWQLGRGASMTFLENVVGNGVFFGSNELMRRQLARHHHDDCDGDSGVSTLVSDVTTSSTGASPSSLGLTQEAVIGGLTGILFQLVIYPADLIKARLMTQEEIHARQVARQILREDGLRGFYRGASVTVLRACIINAAGWPALRWTQQYLAVS